MKILKSLLISIFFLLSSVSSADNEVNYEYRVIAEGLDRPWSLAVVDDSNIIFKYI